jgi:hypothetical protein
MAAFDERPSMWFGVSPAVIDEAREALTQGRRLTPVSVSSGHDATSAPLINSTTRLGIFQHQLEAIVHAAQRAGASTEAIDVLLAVAITLSELFPEAN